MTRPHARWLWWWNWRCPAARIPPLERSDANAKARYEGESGSLGTLVRPSLAGRTRHDTGPRAKQSPFRPSRSYLAYRNCVKRVRAYLTRASSNFVAWPFGGSPYDASYQSTAACIINSPSLPLRVPNCEMIAASVGWTRLDRAPPSAHGDDSDDQRFSCWASQQ